MATQIHPRVAVDAVLFTINHGELRTLLIKIKNGVFGGRWAFPGGLVQVAEAAAMVLEKVALVDLVL